MFCTQKCLIQTHTDIKLLRVMAVVQCSYFALCFSKLWVDKEPVPVLEENCLRRKYGHWGYKNTIMLLWLLAGICLPYSEFCPCTKNHRSESHWGRTQGYSFPICKLQIGGTNQTKLDTFALQIISQSKLTKGISKLQNKIVHPRTWIIHRKLSFILLLIGDVCISCVWIIVYSNDLLPSPAQAGGRTGQE